MPGVKGRELQKGKFNALTPAKLQRQG
jgi:hypothetical protein